MKNVAVFFGGQSVEHEVSVITALQLMENINTEKYHIVPVYIDKQGIWRSDERLKKLSSYQDKSCNEAAEVFMNTAPGDFNLYGRKAGFLKKSHELAKIDICFPALHGTKGEDGSIQGFFELKNIPYVGASVLASALGMDKIVMKKLFKAHGLPVVNHKWFYRKNYQSDKEQILGEIEREMNYPLIVKPSNLGSSIGISTAEDREALIGSIEVACQYDQKILVEEKMENCREINCAVLGIGDNIEASLCEEPMILSDILSFKDKYVQKSKQSASKTSPKRKIPAEIPLEIEEKVKRISKEAFMAIDAAGVARIDFLYCEQKSLLYINEINTMPGSISYYLWEKLNINFKMLTEKLIEIALYAESEKKNTKYAYDEINLFAQSFQQQALK